MHAHTSSSIQSRSFLLISTLSKKYSLPLWRSSRSNRLFIEIQHLELYARFCCQNSPTRQISTISFNMILIGKAFVYSWFMTRTHVRTIWASFTGIPTRNIDIILSEYFISLWLSSFQTSKYMNTLIITTFPTTTFSPTVWPSKSIASFKQSLSGSRIRCVYWTSLAVSAAIKLWPACSSVGVFGGQHFTLCRELKLGMCPPEAH